MDIVELCHAPFLVLSVEVDDVLMYVCKMPKKWSLRWTAQVWQSRWCVDDRKECYVECEVICGHDRTMHRRVLSEQPGASISRGGMLALCRCSELGLSRRRMRLIREFDGEVDLADGRSFFLLGIGRSIHEGRA